MRIKRRTFILIAIVLLAFIVLTWSTEQASLYKKSVKYLLVSVGFGLVILDQLTKESDEND